MLLDASEATEEQRTTLTVAAPDLGKELAGSPRCASSTTTSGPTPRA